MYSENLGDYSHFEILIWFNIYSPTQMNKTLISMIILTLSNFAGWGSKTWKIAMIFKNCLMHK